MLLIDDDAADSSLVLGALRHNSQVGSVFSYHEPETALKELSEGRRRPDLILLDINMPKMDGFTFIERLNAIPYASETPVVFLTTSRFVQDVQRARASVACAYIAKPDSFDELKRRIDLVVGQAISGKWS
ncbi:MAG: response regulator [Pseudomonadota bacterium]